MRLPGRCCGHGKSKLIPPQSSGTPADEPKGCFERDNRRTDHRGHARAKSPWASPIAIGSCLAEACGFVGEHAVARSTRDQRPHRACGDLNDVGIAIAVVVDCKREALF